MHNEFEIATQVTEDTLFAACDAWLNKALPLFREGADQCVGARKESMRVTATAALFSISTFEETRSAVMHSQFLHDEVKEDSSGVLEPLRGYSADRVRLLIDAS